MEDKVIATTYISNETYQKIRSLSKETGIKVSALYEKLIHIGLKNFKGGRDMKYKGGDLKKKEREEKVTITFYIPMELYDELQEFRNTYYRDLTRPAFYRKLIETGLKNIKKEV